MFVVVAKELLTQVNLLQCLKCLYLFSWHGRPDPAYCPHCGRKDPAAKGD